jgi:hypothetical protein
MRFALAVLILLLLSGAAEAQYTLDATGGRYKCVTSCTVMPPPGAPLQPLSAERRRPAPPPYVPCGSRCDLLDRMK